MKYRLRRSEVLLCKVKRSVPHTPAGNFTVLAEQVRFTHEVYLSFHEVEHITEKSKSFDLLFSHGEGEICPSTPSRHALGGKTVHRTVFGLCPTAFSNLSVVKQKRHLAVSFCFTEKERFELSRREYRPTPLAGAPLRPLEYFSVH